MPVEDKAVATNHGTLIFGSVKERATREQMISSDASGLCREVTACGTVLGTEAF
jgi:hypothetical protein